MLHVKIAEGTHLLPEKKIIKALEYAQYVEYHSLIAEAKAKAEAILAGAQKAFDEERKKGFAKGEEEGKAKLAEHMLESIDKSIRNLEAFEEQVIDIVMKAINRILGEMEDKDKITRVVKQSLALVRNQKRVALKVNPSDARILEAEVDEVLKSFPGIGYIDIIADGRIPAGSCMLETDIGVVDARLDVQVEAIRKSLTKSIK